MPKVFPFLICLFLSLSATAQRLCEVRIDSALFYDLSLLEETENCGIGCDTLSYAGERYVTNVDLFANGVRYYHVPGFPVPPGMSLQDARYIIERRACKEKSPRTSNYLFECDSAGYVLIAGSAADIPFRNSPQLFAVVESFQTRNEGYVVFPAAKAEGNRTDAVSGNLLTRGLYLFVGYWKDAANGIRYPLQIVKVKPLRIIPAGTCDDPVDFSRYLARKARELKFTGKGTAGLRIVIDPAGRPKQVFCDNEAFRPFLETALASMPAGAFSPYFLTFVSALTPGLVRIYPVLDYRIVCGGNRKITVEYSRENDFPVPE